LSVDKYFLEYFPLATMGYCTVSTYQENLVNLAIDRNYRKFISARDIYALHQSVITVPLKGH